MNAPIIIIIEEAKQANQAEDIELARALNNEAFGFVDHCVFKETDGDENFKTAMCTSNIEQLSKALMDKVNELS